ncbi:hypothetical protein JCM10213_000175 [Rhodosporidiobolus nylandii]
MEALPPSPFSLLPIDILDLICTAILSFPRAVSTSTLLSLCRTSRAWCAAAQPALFRHPFLSFDAPDVTPPRTYSRLGGLLHTLRRRPDLASAVQAFDLGRYTARCQTEAKVDRRLVSRLAVDLAEACTNLRELSVPFVTQADKHDLLVPLRRLSSLRSFTFGEGASTADPWVVNVDIAIKDQWGTAIWTRGDFAALAKSWPRLKRVVLQARVRGLEADQEVILWQLEEFELSLFKNVKLSFPYLDRLLSNCRATGSLRRLILKEHQLHPEDLVSLVEAYGGSLETLETTTANRFARNEPFLVAIASSCRLLRTLRIGTPIYDLPGVLHELSQLPRLRSLALETVLLQRLSGTGASLAGEVRRFKALEQLSLTPGYHGDPGDDLERFTQFQLKLRALRRTLQGEVEVVVREPFV